MKRLPKFNEYAFNELSNESAYWLGFITADGSISNKSKALSVSIKQSDRMHLEKLSKFVNFTGLIYEYVHTSTGKSFTQCYLNLVSLPLINRMNDFGIAPRKSYTDINQLQYIPDEYKYAFLLGNLDGDGYIRIRSRNRGQFSWLGQKELIAAIGSWFSTNDINCKIHKRADCNLYTCTVYNMVDRLKLCELYLSLGNVPLERKRIKVYDMYTSLNKIQKVLK